MNHNYGRYEDGRLAGAVDGPRFDADRFRAACRKV
jgi:hypothetical protein